MVMINHATREITAKIVYYGPGLCGKTTNLEYIYKTATPEKKGKLLTVATETDRTLFFDFLPMELGNIKGLKLRTQLYTVPGQVFYDATRRIVLRGADGVVFVADSQKSMIDSNIESLENLKTNLKINNLDPETIPIVFQYNKRDLENLIDIGELDKELNWRNVPSFPASAIKGAGVNETLRKIIELVIINLHQKEASLKGTKESVPQKVSPPPAPPETIHPEKEETEVAVAQKVEENAEIEQVEEIKEIEEVDNLDIEEKGEEQVEIAKEEEIREDEEKEEISSMAPLENDKIVEIAQKVSDLQEKIYSVLNELDEIKQKISELKG
jgi:small GTP-binding protein